MSNDKNTLALIKKDVVDVVGKKVQEFVSRGELHLPPNYSVENAMKSAWLIRRTNGEWTHYCPECQEGMKC